MKHRVSVSSGHIWLEVLIVSDCSSITLPVTYDDLLLEAPDNFEAHIKILDEIDNSFESELDRSTYEQGPKLILCDSCSKEYLIPSWIK